jgi:hypothetical protein
MIKPPWNCESRNNNVKATPEMTRILVPPIKKKNKYIRTREKEDGGKGKKCEVRTSISFIIHESDKL